MSFARNLNTGPRRAMGKIKPPQAKTVSVEETWTRLSKAIEMIQLKRASQLSFEETYRYAYRMVRDRHSEQLYEGVSRLVGEHLDREATTRILPAFPHGNASTSTNGADAEPLDAKPFDMGISQRASGTDRLAQLQRGERFLAAIKAVWDDHVTCMKRLGDILKYMDKVYVPTMPQRAKTFDLGLELFQTHIIDSPLPIAETLITAILAQIHFEREGEVINRSAVHSCTEMLNGLNTHAKNGRLATSYKVFLEDIFLNQSRAFYNEESTTLLATATATEYLIRVDLRLAEEVERVRYCLHEQTESALVTLLEDVLITQHFTAILDHETTGLDSLVEGDRMSEIKRLFRLFSRVPQGAARLRAKLQEYIVKRGKEINNSREVMAEPAPDPAKGKGREGKPAQVGGAAHSVSLALQWVQQVLDLKDKMDRIWSSALAEDKSFQTAINEAFKTFIETNKQSPEYVSLFIDDNLKKGLKGKSEAEVDVVLDKAVVIFRFLSDRDIFERYYQQHFAKRLLAQRSVSDDAERGLLAKLKVESGAMFVRKLEGMLNDMTISEETNKQFRKHLTRAGVEPLPIDLAVTVCQSGQWPMEVSSSQCILPASLRSAQLSFERFYHTKTSGRKLTWHTTSGSVDVTVRFKARKHELNVSTQAMAVLSCFEPVSSLESLSYKDLEDQTGIAENELKRTLQSLACAKYKILQKSPKGRDVNPATDRFAFNEEFTSNLMKIKIMTVANKVETVEERSETDSKVEEARKFLVQAAIVRVMKQRNRLPHSDLTHEVIRQLAGRFAPKLTMIKQAIDKLIESEYLERDQDDRRVLRYLAPRRHCNVSAYDLLRGHKEGLRAYAGRCARIWSPPGDRQPSTVNDALPAPLDAIELHTGLTVSKAYKQA
ncbi:uncharacterized protein L969DRAFT_92046 [Mixia osmundae IAM 14324]|uniref:Cullin family profile domain-containing protein n=1 Tax=Mixia osmundae (strain CBS 9802 / IAM 14324 / JCM 22182 / KY 12970) TaxID=764103 RepID=G7DZB2_MIXOS|nr:uncharacterized protein L969DRAFT_92046 [Mixia osmundae IAM 14324]KEI42612.1 hypothetical protein L969DRAFT_92046 [Mixia osmundae IAM 14324]GAA95922.1 hypothetical protein E5Q_02580 [Mixia osmundae IAM 14324]